MLDQLWYTDIIKVKVAVSDYETHIGNEIQPTTLQSQNVMGKLQQPFNIKKSARINIFLNTVYFVLGRH